MTDLWYVFGAMSYDIGLYEVLKKRNPKFRPMRMLVTEIDGIKPAIQFEHYGAGYLDKDTTVKLRLDFRDYLAKSVKLRNPLVVSLHTAAKFNQLWNIYGSELTKCMSLANQAVKAAKMSAPSSGLLTAVGACLLTETLIAGMTPEIGKEFGVQDAEYDTLLSVIGNTKFGTAYTKLLAAPCWQGYVACADAYSWYDKYERAVN